MLTTRFVIAGAAFIAAASLAGISPAAADWTITSSCVGHWGMGSCVVNKRYEPRDPHVRHVYGDAGEHAPREVQERESIERDRKWLAYCRPALIKDRYGVERYHYAKRGCEFGRSED